MASIELEVLPRRASAIARLENGERKQEEQQSQVAEEVSQDEAVRETDQIDQTDQVEQVDQVVTSPWMPRIICLASFITVFTACGLNFVFGLYQALYEELSTQSDTPFSGASPAQIDLIGTFSIALMTAGAPFAVAWSKQHSPRAVAMAGGLLFGVAGVAASFGQRLWHFVLTQGVLAGVGSCLSYMSACTVAPSWFSTHRGLAMGLITSGTGIGGVVWAPMLRACFDAIGYRNTLRLIGAISAALLIGAGAVLDWEPATKARLRMEAAARGGRTSQFSLLDWNIVRTRVFAAQAAGCILHGAAYYTPVFFFASYARALGYNDTAGANFTALSNACNAVGKIAIGHLADRLGRVNTLLATTLCAAITVYAFWLPSTLDAAIANTVSRALYMVFLIGYGVFASAYIGLFPVTLVELFGVQHFASVNGVLYMVRGLSTLVGTPVGSALVRSGTAATAREFLGMAVLVGALLFAATVAVGWVRFEAQVTLMRRGAARGWKM